MEAMGKAIAALVQKMLEQQRPVARSITEVRMEAQDNGTRIYNII